ncbi:hypothetical protein DV515_00013856 [Chloebia gouldiae]|uniref:Arf-GAP domain-containing protein n=1 Tax=Chloebia gouldiae TaxID=44316 RepID=A0A3L8S043_CHLGU|nr:hypothetical protein DV515_00013856 [Chloebia gouldiae]
MPPPDPGWASINRGVLICDECCSVHRSLGRHISIVKHLRHSPWPATLLQVGAGDTGMGGMRTGTPPCPLGPACPLQMVHTLASNGANSIWEHSLLDPAQVQSGRRKANPQDKVHPTKSEFIRAKYQMLAFVHKLPCRDDDGVTAKDLSKQLHSSVRTGNLETCLRLLSLGAQANFFHPEKGTTPLHVAAKAGQILQAELLVVYGADPGAPDVNGRTPIDYARQAAQHELAERLVECQYELTDRLAFYLCGRKPDHKNGHYIIPQMADR